MISRKYILDLQKTDPENKKCVDCNAGTPTWIDLKYGSFLCTQCAGLHRELGTDYCVIKSISLDNLSKEQLRIFEYTKGNTFVNLEYEALDQSEVMRIKPRSDSSVQIIREFIRRKYKIKQFYKQYTPPPQPKKVEQPIMPKPVLQDMIQFDQQIQAPQQVQAPPTFEVNWGQPVSTTWTPPIQQALTQKQQEELEYKSKVNGIMNMFNY